MFLKGLASALGSPLKQVHKLHAALGVKEDGLDSHTHTQTHKKKKKKIHLSRFSIVSILKIELIVTYFSARDALKQCTNSFQNTEREANPLLV